VVLWFAARLTAVRPRSTPTGTADADRTMHPASAPVQRSDTRKENSLDQDRITHHIAHVRALLVALIEAPGSNAPFQRELAPEALAAFDRALDTLAVAIGELEQPQASASLPPTIGAAAGAAGLRAQAVPPRAAVAEQRFRDLIQRLDAIVWEADAQTEQCTFVSQQAEVLLGYPVERWLAEPEFWITLIHPEDRAQAAAVCRAATQAGRDHAFACRAVTADARVVWLRTIVRAIPDAAGRARQLCGLMLDITEHKHLEAQFLQAQKLASVGRLASGMAHDFNNLLTGILGYADFALLDLPPESQVQADLLEICKAAERAAGLARQILAVARQQSFAPQIVNLNDLILDVDKLLRRLIGEDIELITLPAADLRLVRADPGQLAQVLLNLAVNARDAMPHGGKLLITTANVVLDQASASQHADIVPGDYVLLVVRDTGTGMTDAVQQHLFEPFFTTKADGRGTGLGLATCDGIVKQHGGHLRFSSAVGQGTTFAIYLPRVEDVAGPPPTRSDDGAIPGGTEMILLAEDEPTVRTLVARILRARGYTVLEAADGEDALRIAQEHAGVAIQLLLTDVVMPRMGGPVLAARLTALRPTIKVLFTSGYTDAAIVQHGMLDPGVAFLPKPYRPATLVRKVREVLDA